MITVHDIAEICGGSLVNTADNFLIKYLFTDSRQHFQGEDSLFFAIKTDRNNGHKFIPELYERGCRNFVVSERPDMKALPEANVILVKDAVLALQGLGLHKRKGFRGTLLAITGSNGKTIVKEWLYQLLAPHRYVVKSPASYNSQIGVPLSLWNLNENHEIALIEAGISMVGEMETLAEIIQPEIGIFTNIGSSHDGGFHNLEEKINEKVRLFEQCKVVICCGDHEKVLASLVQKNIPVYTWGKSNSANLKILNTKQLNDKTLIKVEVAGRSFEFKIPFTENIFLENVMHCIALLIYLKVDVKTIQSGVFALSPVNMRLNVRKGQWGNLILDDTYNNDLVGLSNAAQFLQQLSTGRIKMMILSDIYQSGLPASELYKKVSELIVREEVEEVLAVGPEIQGRLDAPDCKIEYYADSHELLASGYLDELRHSSILVKGARNFYFEKVVKYLEGKTHHTRLEVNLANLVHNLSYYRSLIKNETKMMVMVKALSYGSGTEIPALLQHIGVDYLGVAYIDEGIQLRKKGIDTKIMVMNSHEEDIDMLLKHNLEPEVYSFSFLKKLTGKHNNRNLRVHIKIETGMNRLGFSENQSDELIKILQENPHIETASIFSHLAASENTIHDEFTHRQAGIFYRVATELKRKVAPNAIFHLVNSTGITRFPMYHFHMVRMGIGMHGISPLEEDKAHLLRVESYKTYVSQIRTVTPEESVGYGRAGRVSKNRKIATLAVGYADGFRRSLGNGKGYVMINGKKAFTIGNVCMDMCMVDVTDIDVSEGDEAVIFGPELTLEDYAAQLDTIPYEVLTSVSERVKRVYFYG